MAWPEFAAVEYGSEPRRMNTRLRSTLVCPCGVSNPAMLWPVTREGLPDLAFPLLVECQGCGRRITRDGAVVRRSVYDQEREVG